MLSYYHFRLSLELNISDGFGYIVSCNAEFPFEFWALEVALEAICSCLDARTRELEAEAYSALDELTSKVTESSSFAQNIRS